MSKIEYLDWDSSFFLKKIGKVEIVENNFTIDNVQNDFNDYDLVYVFSNHKLTDNSLLLVDKKVTYKKNITNCVGTSEITLYNNDYLEQLIELGLQSGKYSRFKLDKNFVDNEYERLYTKWIIKSVEDPNTEIFIEKKEDKIVGFVTLIKRDDQQAEIGLVAVDESYRGKGIGKKIMNIAINNAHSNNLKIMRVVTQLFNTPACKLYESIGFEIEDVKYIYHLWINEQNKNINIKRDII